MLVIGDLNIDYVIKEDNVHGGKIVDSPLPAVGGTGFNAAVAFQAAGLNPIVFGKTGDDLDGQTIRDALSAQKLTVFLGLANDKPTGNCTLIFVSNHARWMIQQRNNANDYDERNLQQVLDLCQIGEGDTAFFVGHPLVRFPISQTVSLLRRIAKTGARIIVDLVPHNLYETVTLEELKSVLDCGVHMLIAEYATLMRFFGHGPIAKEPANGDVKQIMDALPMRVLIVRFGVGNISQQQIWKRENDGHLYCIDRTDDTGYEKLTGDEKRGFGDRLTARVLTTLSKELG
jgi:sugar/nucleoside kinase (ribokinase family)